MNAPTYIPILQQRWNNVCRVFSLAATLWDACAFCGTWLTRQRWHAARRFKVGPFLAWVRPVDFSALDEILTAREYDCTRRILSQAGPAPLVIDAGANIGLFALTAFATRPDAVVHSLEPGARTFEVLQRNAASNPSL
ncbi:MAG: hypothetical protein HZA91_01175, partial [Verrucomicrobia bacterium]|nr:hypothetical protein [Verrucomicrobiota bacterium]